MRPFTLSLALLCLAGCASMPAAPAGEAPAFRSLAVSAEPPWPRPDRTQQLRNLQAANVPFMPGDHSTTPLHYHAQVQVTYQGQPVTVPADVGIVDGRMAVLHTHDDTGTIHIEDHEGRPYTLGQFFTVWGVPLTGARVTANGMPVSDPAGLVLREGQQIRVDY